MRLRAATNGAKFATNGNDTKGCSLHLKVRPVSCLRWLSLTDGLDSDRPRSLHLPAGLITRRVPLQPHRPVNQKKARLCFRPRPSLRRDSSTSRCGYHSTANNGCYAASGEPHGSFQNTLCGSPRSQSTATIWVSVTATVTQVCNRLLDSGVTQMPLYCARLTLTVTRSVSEECNFCPHLRFGLRWNVPFLTACSIKY